jgi:hypothetical protein
MLFPSFNREFRRKLGYAGLSFTKDGNQIAYSMNWSAATNGATLPGETFTTGTGKTYFDAAGLIQTAGANTARRNLNPATGLWSRLVEPLTRTQLVTPTASIRDLTNAAWAKTTMTTALTSTGADGTANSATRCTATAGNAMVLQTLVIAAASRTFSPLIRRANGVGNIEITQDGVSWTNIAPLINSSNYRLVQLNATQLNPSFGIRIVTNGDAIDVDFTQFEDGASATSRMPSTAAFDPDVLTLPTSGNLINASGFVAGSFTPTLFTTDQGVLLSTFNGGTEGIPLYFFGGQVRSYDGTSAGAGASYTPAFGTIAKLAATWGGVTWSSASSGVAATNAPAFDADMGLGANLRIGAHINGTVPICLELHSLRMGFSALSPGLLSFVAR